MRYSKYDYFFFTTKTISYHEFIQITQSVSYRRWSNISTHDLPRIVLLFWETKTRLSRTGIMSQSFCRTGTDRPDRFIVGHAIATHTRVGISRCTTLDTTLTQQTRSDISDRNQQHTTTHNNNHINNSIT